MVKPAGKFGCDVMGDAVLKLSEPVPPGSMQEHEIVTSEEIGVRKEVIEMHVTVPASPFNVRSVEKRDFEENDF